MYFGYQTVGGYTPLLLLRYYEYFNQYANNELPDGLVWLAYGVSKNKTLMDLLNMKYEQLKKNLNKVRQELELLSFALENTVFSDLLPSEEYEVPQKKKSLREEVWSI